MTLIFICVWKSLNRLKNISWWNNNKIQLILRWFFIIILPLRVRFYSAWKYKISTHKEIPILVSSSQDLPNGIGLREVVPLKLNFTKYFPSSSGRTASVSNDNRHLLPEVLHEWGSVWKGEVHIEVGCWLWLVNSVNQQPRNGNCSGSTPQRWLVFVLRIHYCLLSWRDICVPAVSQDIDLNRMGYL